MIEGGKSIAGQMEKNGDLIVNGAKLLSLLRRYEPLRDSLSSARGLMRILRSIVEPLVLAMLNSRNHVYSI